MSLKEVVEKICEPNPRRLIMVDEIAFGSPITGEGIVAIYPFCQQVVRIRESDFEQPVNRASESRTLCVSLESSSRLLTLWEWCLKVGKDRRMVTLEDRESVGQ